MANGSGGSGFRRSKIRPVMNTAVNEIRYNAITNKNDLAPNKDIKAPVWEIQGTPRAIRVDTILRSRLSFKERVASIAGMAQP